jgi:exodeoxyribonuclease VIII
MREPGIYKDIDIDAYHADEGISSSGISLILDCPKRYHYEYYVKEKESSKDNDKFVVGQAVHTMILEPDEFDNRFYLMKENVNLTTKIGKAIYEEAMLAAQGRTILRFDKAREVNDMGLSIKQHSIWNKIKLTDGNVENSVYWDAGIYNTRLRARPDFYNDALIIDLKTTDSIAGFAKSVYNYGYHRQAAMQMDGLEKIDGKKRHFAFFVVEKKAPYLTACFTLDDAAIEQGRKEYLEGAATYSECLRFDMWPGYDEKFQLLSLPKWATKTEDEEMI